MSIHGRNMFIKVGLGWVGVVVCLMAVWPERKGCFSTDTAQNAAAPHIFVLNLVLFTQHTWGGTTTGYGIPSKLVFVLNPCSLSVCRHSAHFLAT